VRLYNDPSYPVPTAVWSTLPTAEAMDAMAALGVGMHQIPAAAAEVVPAGQQVMGLVGQPWSEASIAEAVAAVGKRARFMGLGHDRGEVALDGALELTAHMAEALPKAGVAAWVVSPPIDVGTSAAEGQIATAGALGADGKIISVNVRPPVARAANVWSVSVGKKPLAGALSSWADLARQSDLTETANAVRAQARLPLLVSDIRGVSSGSAAMDALSLARIMITSAYQGSTGLALFARPEDAPEGEDAFCLLDSNGEPRPGVAEVFTELSRELAGTVPVTALVQTEEIGFGDNAEIGFRPFMRRDEGIVALYNNTSGSADLLVEVRTIPLDLHTLTIGAAGVRRDYSPTHRFSEEAHAMGRPVIPVKLEPGEVTVLSMQMASIHAAWLAGIEYAPDKPKADGPVIDLIHAPDRR